MLCANSFQQEPPSSCSNQRKMLNFINLFNWNTLLNILRSLSCLWKYSTDLEKDVLFPNAASVLMVLCFSCSRCTWKKHCSFSVIHWNNECLALQNNMHFTAIPFYSFSVCYRKTKKQDRKQAQSVKIQQQKLLASAEISTKWKMVHEVNTKHNTLWDMKVLKDW